MTTALNSLRGRVLLIVFLTIIPIFGLVLFSTFEQQRVAVNEALQEAQVQTQRISANNAQYIESTRMLLTALAQLPTVREKQTQTCNRLFEDLLAQYEIYSSLFVVDTGTNLGICSAIPYREPVDNSPFPWYEEVLRERRFTVSAYRIGPVSKRPVLTMALPVRDDDGEITAVVAASLSLEWLNRFVATADLPPDTTITLIDSAGVVLSRYPHDELMIGERWQNEAVREAALNNMSGWLRGVDAASRPRIYVYSEFGRELGDLNVIVSIPEAVALAEVETTFTEYVVGLLIITALVIAIAWISSEFITRPIHILTETSERLSSGLLHVRPRLNTGIVELQRLLEAFNRMAGAVEVNILSQMQQLERANAQLQEEIAARTRLEQRTSLLKDLTAALSEAVSIEQVNRAIADKAVMPLGGDELRIALRQPPATHLLVYRLQGDECQSKTLDLSGDHVMLEVYRTRQLLWLETIPDTPALAEFRNTASLLCLPLIIGQRVFGSLLVGFARPQAMGTEFRELATTMVDYAAQALERARLYEAETEARREAENANALRVQFTGMISHELRTPLSSVKGFISTLLADDVEWSAEEIRRFLTIADLEADKLNVLVEQLLDLTRFQAGSLEIYPAHHTLREVIRVAEAQLTTLTREHHLVIHLADKLPPVNIDIQRIAQVIVNLVGNAAKFSPPNTTICLTVEAVEGEVRVEVSDDGIGIPEEAREYIFEAFRQIDGTARRGNKGAGLGLAICKALVELHGGKIWVEESGGGGTTMVFTLPARP